MTPLASTQEEAPPEVETTPAAEPVELDMGAETGTLGEVSVSPGFTPDPTTYTGTVDGPQIELEVLDDRCSGWAAAAPDLVMHTTRPFAELVLMVGSARDTTIAVAGPDGQLRCGDDEDGQHPIVRGTFEAGTHRIWVGASERGTVTPYVLGISEFDDSRPSSLLH